MTRSRRRLTFSRYGTFDHLLLVQGRLADFAARDIIRKRKASTLSSTNNIEIKLDSEEATQIWEGIRQAFEGFRAQLGPEFEPLETEFTHSRGSPFGLILQYRTLAVAGIWMNYYMSLIHLYRAHPSASPISLIAAGTMGRETAEYANTIGRIAAGLIDDSRNVAEVSLSVGAVLIETCFSLFVAGIQVSFPCTVEFRRTLTGDDSTKTTPSGTGLSGAYTTLGD